MLVYAMAFSLFKNGEIGETLVISPTNINQYLSQTHHAGLSGDQDITKTRLFKYIENFTTKKGKFSNKKFW